MTASPSRGQLAPAPSPEECASKEKVSREREIGASRLWGPGSPAALRYNPSPKLRGGIAMSVTTLSELFLKAAGHNKPDCMLSKSGGTYQPMSTAELVDR